MYIVLPTVSDVGVLLSWRNWETNVKSSLQDHNWNYLGNRMRSGGGGFSISPFSYTQTDSETHTKRQATQQDCLPSLLGDRRWGQMNWNSVRRGRKYFVLGRLQQPRQEKNLLYWHKDPNEPTKERPLLFVLFESQFASVSTVSRGHP
jgi:hypothetical protein